MVSAIPSQPASVGREGGREGGAHRNKDNMIWPRSPTNIPQLNQPKKEKRRERRRRGRRERQTQKEKNTPKN